MFADSCARERAGAGLHAGRRPAMMSALNWSRNMPTGFIYVVSLTGITGARRELPVYLKDFIARLRARVDKPLVLGFGISTAGHASEVSQLTDGFIVGSALVRAGGEGVEALRELTRSIVEAIC